MEWKTPWLVQVLNKPYPKEGMSKIAGAFSFGGGLKNGGLTDQANEIVSSMWSWEYMGASEYEWGEVPKAMSQLFQGIQSGEYIATYITIKHLYNPIDKSGYPMWVNKNQKKKTESNVFVCCYKDHIDNVKSFLSDIANDKNITRDSARPECVFHPEYEKIKYSFAPIGGLNFENAFIYMTYKPSIEKFCEVFNIVRV